MGRRLAIVSLLAAAIGSAAIQSASAADVAQAGQNARRDAIRVELEAMHLTDQKNRAAISAAGKEEQARLWVEQNKLDLANQKRLDEIVAEAGWPTKSAYGKQAATAAYLIVQHSPLETMKRYYPTLRQAMLDAEMDRENFALVEDRIRMYEKRPQLYGSQVRIVTKDGVSTKEIWQIEDEANVDKRRAEMSLEPLAEYAKHFGITYVPVSQRAPKAEEVKP